MNDTIPPVAMNPFEWTWQQFVKALERNPRLSMNAFCKSVHTHPKGMSTWMHRHGHSVSEIKRTYRKSYPLTRLYFIRLIKGEFTKTKNL